MEINNNLEKRQLTLLKTCIGFTILVILVMFFEADLGRILTPFIEPLFLLLLALVYFALVIITLIHILLQIKNTSWRAFLPISINIITFLSVSYLFVPLTEFRISVEFLIKKNRFNQVTQWVNHSIQNGSLTLEENKEETVSLPKEYQNLTDRDQIYVTQENGVISIFFSRGGGMFEYYPGYKYRSDNTTPPDYGDISCSRKIESHWYDCH